MRKLIFMLVFNLTTAHTVASDAIGEKCAELASESGAVCTTEKMVVNQSPSTDDARSSFRACMKAFVQECRIKFTAP